MKTKSLLALTALCLALPAASSAQGLPEFLSTVGEGIGEGMEKGAAVIAASMEEELGVSLSAADARIEAGKMLTLTVTATNPRMADTPVSFAMKLPERLACAQGDAWEAVLPPAAAGEDGTVLPSVTTFERTIALAPGGMSETAQIVCEMNMGTRFYRAQQDVELCVSDVSITAAIEGTENSRLEPGEAFAWLIEVTNAGMAAEDVELALVVPDGVSPAGELPEGFTLSGSRLMGTVRAESAQVDDAGAAASLAAITLPMQVDADALEGDRDASRLIAGTLYAGGERVPLPRIQVCGPKISAQLVAEDNALEADEETKLRAVVVNEGLVGAQITLSCVLPEGLELIASEQKEEKKDTQEKAAVLPAEGPNGAGPDGVPVLAEGAEEMTEQIAEDHNTVVFTWNMDAAKETEAGVTAATKVFEIPVRSTRAQKDLEEQLVGASLAYSVNGGDTQLGEAEALRLYTPSFMGVTRSEWGGVFWACVLMMITVACLYAAVRAGKDKEEYFCCE